MMKWVWLLAIVGELRAVRGDDLDQGQYTEDEGRVFIERLNEECSTWGNRLANAEWDYDSNLTDYNLQKKLDLSSQYAVYYKGQWEEVIKYPWKTFQDASLKRQFKFYSILGTAALPEEKRLRLDEVVATMSDIYSTKKLLDWKLAGPRNRSIHAEPTVSLEPDYTDTSAVWNEDFEMDDFDDAIHQLYLQILPFYQQLHAYVRRKLAKHYNSKHHRLIQKNGCLPAHILGNMWAQTWHNVYNFTAPYPGKTSVDVTPTMRYLGLTPLDMFQMSEEFYTSLNLQPMTKTFWEKSIIEKPTDREMVCHASAWEFDDGDDFRIKMCTKVNLEDFKTIHHEMGHIQYYMQYKDQPKVFRGGANSGFHEAVGDTISLSVSTAEHLIKVGLLDSNYEEDEEADINSLYLMALEKIAFLPFAYVLDLWRWEVFRGKVDSKDYNCRYWQLRQELQGIVPPVDRSAKDFDPGAKYHVIADVPYIRYFVSFIIQFQFHKALCIEAGQYNPDDPASKPLHHCDIYQSKAAGDLFGKMLQMGSSKPPQDAMEVITGQRDMDAGPLLEYFKPLHDWLIQENQRTGTKIGWEDCNTITCRNGRVKVSPEAKRINNRCRYYHSKGKGSKRPKKENVNEEA